MTWLLVAAILIAGFLVARAIEQSRPIVNSSPSATNAQNDELHAVSQIAATLIAAQFSNPEYVEGMKNLREGREAASYEAIHLVLQGASGNSQEESAAVDGKIASMERIRDEHADLIYKSSVFTAGREKFIELAWNIYRDVAQRQNS